MPIQAAENRPGCSAGAFFGYFFVGCERDDEERVPRAEELALRARELDDRVLVAME
jgi:hypothetical protein